MGARRLAVAGQIGWARPVDELGQLGTTARSGRKGLGGRMVARVRSALGALLDLWLWIIAGGSGAVIGLAILIGLGTVPRVPSPGEALALAHAVVTPSDTALRLVGHVQRTWGDLQAVLERNQQGCRIVLGFGKVESQLGPSTVGECVENERHDPQAGVTSQATTRGLLVWRRGDGALAFTDGHRTWLLGPAGLQRRLNAERLCWEADADPRTCVRG